MRFWINSNSGDYISEVNGIYKLHQISRCDGDEFYGSITTEISIIQFQSLKGFIPIKAKKLGTRLREGMKRYSSKRVELPTIQDSRNERLNKIGI